MQRHVTVKDESCSSVRSTPMANGSRRSSESTTVSLSDSSKIVFQTERKAGGHRRLGEHERRERGRECECEYEYEYECKLRAAGMIGGRVRVCTCTYVRGKGSSSEHKDRKKKVGGRDIGMPEKGGKSGARVAREPKG